MRVLDLFSGTHSVGKYCKSINWEVITLDINKYKNYPEPTHIIDIMKWDYTIYPENHFNIIWASIPCIYFSQLQKTWIGRYKRNEKGDLYEFTKKHYEKCLLIADGWALKTLEIIKYFNPTYYFIENPATGLLGSRKYMRDVPSYVLDYCKYNNYMGYRKRTRIFTNIKDFKPLLCKKDCENLQIYNDRLIHKRSLGGNTKYQKAIGGGNNRLDKYRIPPLLIKALFKKCV